MLVSKIEKFNNRSEQGEWGTGGEGANLKTKQLTLTTLKDREKKKMKKNEQRLRYLWDTMEHQYKH